MPYGVIWSFIYVRFEIVNMYVRDPHYPLAICDDLTFGNTTAGLFIWA